MDESTGATSECRPLGFGLGTPHANAFNMRQFWKFVQVSENAQAARVFVESQGCQLINTEYLKNEDSYRKSLIDQNIFRMPPPNCLLLDKTTAEMSFPDIELQTSFEHAVWLNAQSGLYEMCRTGEDLPKKTYLYVFNLERKKIVIKCACVRV
jgi:hypothetical protein